MGEGKKTVLLVEDEEKLAELLTEYLEASGYTVAVMHEGTRVVDKVRQSAPDLILLDLMLPGKDGLEICKEVRTFSSVPVIMVTAKVDEIDRLLGLELGADDYICKPYSPREVVARVKAVLRRAEKNSVKDEQQAIAGLTLDQEKFKALYYDTPLDLTPSEFRLLVTLAEYPGKVFSRNQLMGHIYSDQRIVTDRTVDTHVKNLRKKMLEIDCEKELISSVYGVGYKIEP